MRGMRRVYAPPMSLTIVSAFVKVTTWPAETMSCTQTRAVWYNGKWVGAYVGYLLDRLGLHISVANGCPWRGGADVGLPVGVDREESTGCGGHHGSAIQDGVGVIGRCVDVLHDGLGSGVVVCCGIVAGVVWVWIGWR